VASKKAHYVERDGSDLWLQVGEQGWRILTIVQVKYIHKSSLCLAKLQYPRESYLQSSPSTRISITQIHRIFMLNADNFVPKPYHQRATTYGKYPASLSDFDTIVFSGPQTLPTTISTGCALNTYTDRLRKRTQNQNLRKLFRPPIIMPCTAQ
jgi:hypothetical protein